jgi:hypothetical protein
MMEHRFTGSNLYIRGDHRGGERRLIGNYKAPEKVYKPSVYERVTDHDYLALCSIESCCFLINMGKYIKD